MACALADPLDAGYEVRRVSDSVGRGLFVTRAFRRGETILKESPLVCSQFAWNAHLKYRACHLCLAPLETAQENVTRLSHDENVILPRHDLCATRPDFHVKCPRCQVEYCSRDCLDSAERLFHRTLCLNGATSDDARHPLNALRDTWRQLHYPPESTSIDLVLRLLASVVQSEAPEEQMQKYLNFEHATRDQETRAAHKLLGEVYADQLELLRHGVRAVFAGAGAGTSCIEPLLSPDGFRSLFALVGRNGQGVATSPFSHWARQAERVQSARERQELESLTERVYEALDRHAGLDFLDNEGSALYALQSMCNHSCLPNARVEFPFNSSTLVVNATCNLQPGDEVLISYLDECVLERGQHSRNKVLGENYLFRCLCPKCQRQRQEDDVSCTSEEDMDDDEDDDDDDDDDRLNLQQRQQDERPEHQ